MSAREPGAPSFADAALYVGEVVHVRHRPRAHRLAYRVFSLLVDIDALDDLDARVRGFGHNRAALVSVHDADFGDGTVPGETPRAWVERCLARAGLPPRPARVLLSCYPRVLGYAFNPIALWYCLDESGEPFAIVHEVHNTFGERHAYVLPAELGADGRIRQRAEKALYVSPFTPPVLEYRFALDVPGARQRIEIGAHDEGGLLLEASWWGERRPLTSRSLAWRVLRMPLSTRKVIVGIHVEAFKLWCKRLPVFRHPSSVVARPADSPSAAPAALVGPAVPAMPVAEPASR